MEKYTFHRDDLVPEEIDTEEKLKEYMKQFPKRKFKIRDKVRNIHNLKIVMHIGGYDVVYSKLLGLKCYWWDK
jgi:hypothetical protein